MGAHKDFVATFPVQPHAVKPTKQAPRTAHLPVLSRHERPRVAFGEHVLRGDRAGLAGHVDLDLDLRDRDAVVLQLMEEQRAAAQAEGYSAGWAQGRREARDAMVALERQAEEELNMAMEEQTEQVQRALDALAGAARTLERRAMPSAAELETVIVEAALALAEAVIGRELAVAAEPGADAIARALALAPVSRAVQVRLHPADVQSVGAGPRELDGRTVTVVADPSLRPGDAVADCDATTIDARLVPALERAREALGL